MNPADVRVKTINDAAINLNGQFVLYWMTTSRRTQWNFGLDRAVQWALEVKKPLLIFEALRIGYPWASERLHRFILDGMADNAAYLDGSSAGYFPYVETALGAGKGLLQALADLSCLVVTDDFPAFFIPRMLASAAKQVRVKMEAVDGNGLLPLDAADRAFTTTASFRRFLQKTLPPFLSDMPAPSPLDEPDLPPFWPMAS